MKIHKHARLSLALTLLVIVGTLSAACQAQPPAATAAPSEVPSAEPGAVTSTEEPQAATGYTSDPMLSQVVRACDVSDGFINFELLEPRPELVGVNAVVTFNGVAVDCTVLQEDHQLLSCPLPPEAVTFPVEITVAMGDAITDQFTYDGAECH